MAVPIQRYGMVSDGKRYHAMQRKPDGEYCLFADVEQNDALQARAYRSFIVNECIRLGVPMEEMPDDMPFNKLVARMLKVLIDDRDWWLRKCNEQMNAREVNLREVNARLSAMLNRS